MRQQQPFGLLRNLDILAQCARKRLPNPAEHSQNALTASDAKTVAFVIDQGSGAGDVRAKPMFGEYGVYCGDRMVAMVCDDQLLVKPTPAGETFASEASYAPPYPGAKPYMLINPERWDDAAWLSEMFRISAAGLPTPRTRRNERRSGPEISGRQLSSAKLRG